MIIEYDPTVPKGAKRFSCKHCDAIFIAEKGEYYTEQKYAYLPATDSTFCPVCNRTVIGSLEIVQV